MPLSQQQLNQLRAFCQQYPGGATGGIDLSAYFADIQANQCACWRWASSGLNTAIADDPAWMFTAITVFVVGTGRFFRRIVVLSGQGAG